MRKASHHIFKAILLKKMYYLDYFLIGPIDDHKYNIEKRIKKMRLPYLFEPCVGEIYSRKLNYTYHIAETMNLTKTWGAQV